MQKPTTIYFSYAWGDQNETGESREQIINKLYDNLENRGYDLRRDKMDLGYKGLISEFMREIGEGNLVIVAISDKYLKSPYCMFELYEIYRNGKLEKAEFVKRIFPIHVESINFNDPLVLDEYLGYWEEKKTAWSNLISKRIDQIGPELFAEHDKVKQISAKFGDLAAFIKDMNALTPFLLAENDFEKLVKEIDKRLEELKIHLQSKQQKPGSNDIDQKSSNQNDVQTPMEQVLDLLERLSITEFKKVVLLYPVPKSEIPPAGARGEQNVAVVEYAIQAEGEPFTKLLNTIYKVAPHLRGNV